VRVPIGDGAPGWVTIASERTILVVLRTIATVSWLLDLLPELVADRRIQVVFTLDDDASAFDDGVLTALRSVSARVIPWSQAIATPFDLAIAASHNGSLDELRSPLMLTSHGIGFMKTNTVPDSGQLPVIDGVQTTVILSHASVLDLKFVS
jgi:hypothetical protein